MRGNDKKSNNFLKRQTALQFGLLLLELVEGSLCGASRDIAPHSMHISTLLCSSFDDRIQRELLPYVAFLDIAT
jgi:hypothetical protein